MRPMRRPKERNGAVRSHAAIWIQSRRLTRQAYVTGCRSHPRENEWLYDTHEGLAIEDRVAVDRHDEFSVVREQMLRGVVQRLPLAAVLGELVKRQPQLRRKRTEPPLDAVRRPVVDHHDLFVAFSGNDRSERSLHELRVLVEAWNEHRNLLSPVARMTPRANIVGEEQREQVPGVQHEHAEIGEAELDPEAALPELVREGECAASKEHPEEPP
jgi:hypothetical protein